MQIGVDKEVCTYVKLRNCNPRMDSGNGKKD